MFKLMQGALALALLVGMALAQPGWAEEDGHDHEHEARVAHYIGEEVTTIPAALESLSHRSEEISALTESEVLTDANFESIHEMSYSLETAVDYLREHSDASKEGLIDSLDEAVQAIHYASEKHEEEKTREWAGKLAAAVKGVSDAL